MKIYKLFYLNKDKEENNYYKLLYPKEYKDEDKEKIDELAYPTKKKKKRLMIWFLQMKAKKKNMKKKT